MNDMSQPAPGDHALTLCHMLSNRIGKAFQAQVEAQGLSVAEWRVVLTLALNDGASGQEITSRWAMDKMAVNRAIARLAGAGLIEKRHNARDRRRVDLSLTERGLALYGRLRPGANRRYRELTACLGRSEREALQNTLAKLIRHADRVTG
jgi:DNA-binding MarR family transcriptional regulator